MDPEPELMAPARAAGADRVELYTEGYAARLRHARARKQVLRAVRRSGAGGAGARAWKSTPATT